MFTYRKRYSHTSDNDVSFGGKKETGYCNWNNVWLKNLPSTFRGAQKEESNILRRKNWRIRLFDHRMYELPKHWVCRRAFAWVWDFFNSFYVYLNVNNLCRNNICYDETRNSEKINVFINIDDLHNFKTIKCTIEKIFSETKLIIV